MTPLGVRGQSQRFEHVGGRPLERPSSDQRADRHHLLVGERFAYPGNRQDRLDGENRIGRGDHDRIGRVDRFEDAGTGTCFAGTVELDGGDAILMLSPHEIRLEVEPGAGRLDLNLGADPVVGRWNDSERDVEGGGLDPGDLAQGRPCRETFGSEEIEGEVHVPESEAGVDSEPFQLFHHPPGVVRSTPSMGAFDAGQAVDDRVDVGADVESVHQIVVSDVDYDRCVGVSRSRESSGHAGAADTACEHHDLHVSDCLTGPRPVTMDPSMTTLPTPEDRALPTTRVVVAVLDVEGGSFERSVSSVRASVYEIDRIVVIGPDTFEGLDRFDSVADLVDALESSVDVVWLLHSDARPRPDALSSLVVEMDRNQASLVGSKIIAADGTRLESVGSATDVFGEPYSGLDPDEVDLEQYDVVRDVAFVSGVSTLVRRDLLRGLGGIDRSMPPIAAGQDLSQRARLGGGRVMIVPSSEVLHDADCAELVPSWRERAGRFRSMMKVYGIVTLIWMIPIASFIGLFDGFVRLFLRQPRILGEHVMVFLWNIWRLPSTFSARRRVRSIRQAGDEELFRYQLPGSVLIRNLASELGERFGWVIDSEPGVVTEEELVSETSRSVPVVVAAALVAVFLAARGIVFSDLPATRFSLPLAGDWLAVLQGYAGSWNPAGLGSLDPVHPSVAFVAAVQGFAGGWTGVTTIISGAALVSGVIGVGRLSGRLGLTGVSRYVAGIAAVIGPFAVAIGEAGDWAGLVAIGVFPWFIDRSIAVWPATWRGRVGRVATLFAVAAVLGSFAPVALVAGAVTVIVVAAFTPGVGSSSLLTMILALDLGALAVSPYIAGVSPDAFFSGGADVDLVIGPVVGGAMVIAAVTAMVAGSAQAFRLAGIGISVVILGTGVALFDVGGDATIAAAVAASLGTGLIVAAALAIDLERSTIATSIQAIGLAAAVLVLGSSLLVIGNGRQGLPSDAWSDRLDFVTGLSGDPDSVRTLVVGLPASMPGDARLGDGYAYRVVTGEVPTLDQARLSPMRIGDRALQEALEHIVLGDELRPGEMLAPFAIEWVVVMDRSRFADAFGAQLDLTEVPLAEGVRVFRNDSYEPRVTTDGAPWEATYAGASGSADADLTVRIADNASVRFGPDWEQDDWANMVSGAVGEITYEPVPLRRSLAIGVAALFAMSIIGAVVGRDPKRAAT